MEAPDWSGKQLRKLGEYLRNSENTDALPFSYNDVRLHFSSLAATVQSRILEEDWRPLLGHRAFEVTSRAKTLDTVIEKLQRDTSTPLSNIQDLAGVRFEAEMSLSQQDAVASAIVAMFGDPQGERAIHDLRSNAHSGYRGVHVWLRLPQRVEVQVRTHLQSAWANLYEEAGDYFGRKIRYGEFPDEPAESSLVEGLQTLSLEGIAQVEQVRESLLQKELQLDDSARAAARADRLGIPRDERTLSTHSQAIELDQAFKAHRETEQKLIRALDGLKLDLRTMVGRRRSAS